MVACALPGWFSFLILCFLPESPKFTIGIQGNQNETFSILQKMNRINNGKNAKLEKCEICEEIESVEHRERILNYQKSQCAFVASVWNQTVPLFKPPHLLSTFLICLLQFIALATTNGFYMFTADILNKMANNLHDFSSQRAMMCDIIHMKPIHYNETGEGDSRSGNVSKVEESIIDGFYCQFSFFV